MSGVHGGVKFYRGAAAAARAYVEADRARVDDYYLTEGSGLATRFVAEALYEGDRPETAGVPAVAPRVRVMGSMDGPAYERWVAGYEVESGAAKGRLRTDAQGLRFVEVVVNGPKSWSLAATLHPKVAAAYDAAQDRAAEEIIGWLAAHATTRVGPRGRQVQVPVERLEAAVVRHYTSRAGDPHRHLHLQVNARVFAAERWRGLHSVGVVDSIEAINGIGHAAVACDPGFREALAAHGLTLDPPSGEIVELAPYVGSFSARSGQITRHLDRYEAEWRADHPGEEPGPRLRRSWDRRAWAQARPDKVVPTDGSQLADQWRHELHDLGYRPPDPLAHPVRPPATPVGRIDRDAVTDLALSRLGARRSSWNAADIRGEVDRIIAAAGVVAPGAVRRELVEDLSARTLDVCVPLLRRRDVPEHVRAHTSRRVLEVEADLIARLTRRGSQAAEPPVAQVGRVALDDDLVARLLADSGLDQTQLRVAAALAGTGNLTVVEGAAGVGKTATLSAAQYLLALQARRMVVVTPTLKAARVAGRQVATDAYSAAWLIHHYGYRWDTDGHRTRLPQQDGAQALLRTGDLLLVDEAGMLDQDTAHALLTIADETGARIAFVGDRHQLPAVGRGGVLDHAARWAPTGALLALEAVHRFTDPDYAALTLLMRTGERPDEVFYNLLERGQIRLHPTDVERQHALASIEGLIVADTRDQVAALNALIRDHRQPDRLTHDLTRRLTGDHAATTGPSASGTPTLTTDAGEILGVGDRVATRRNDRELDVANRDTWTITAVGDDGSLRITGPRGHRALLASYARAHVELAYATTIHGAQGETVDHAHLLLGETTGAAAAYVAMTRGRHTNTAHLVAQTLDEARAQWAATFTRDRADLGPTHATQTALDDIDRYGPTARPRLVTLDLTAPPGHPSTRPEYQPPAEARPSPAISR